MHPPARHQTPNHARHGALAVVHRHVESPDLTVGAPPDVEQPRQSLAGDVRVGPVGNGLFNLFG